MHVRFKRSWLRPFSRWHIYLDGLRLGEVRKACTSGRFTVYDEHGQPLLEAATLAEAQADIERGVRLLQCIKTARARSSLTRPVVLSPFPRQGARV